MTLTFLVLAACCALLPCLIGGLTYTIFYYELANRPHPLFPTGRPGQTARLLARGLATSIASQAVMLLSYPLGRLCRSRRPLGPAPGQVVVVCLHGLYHNPAAFLALRPALARTGVRHVLVPGYPSFRGGFEAVAGRLRADLDRLVPAEAPLIFLGHSLGGLLARRLAAAPDLAGRVRAVITLGSPHGGSKLAGLAVGRLGRSLRPCAGLTEHLGTLPDPPNATRTALVSPVDNMVIPLSGLAIDRPGWALETTPPVSHVAMLYHPAVIARVTALVRPHLAPGRP